MLWFGWDCMFVLLELFDDISRHQNVQSMAVIIPIQLGATVEAAITIFGEFILFIEAMYQMVDIVFVDVFHAKVVDHQGERRAVLRVFTVPAFVCIRSIHEARVICAVTCLLGSLLGGVPIRPVAFRGKCVL